MHRSGTPSLYSPTFCELFASQRGGTQNKGNAASWAEPIFILRVQPTTARSYSIYVARQRSAPIASATLTTLAASREWPLAAGVVVTLPGALVVDWLTIVDGVVAALLLLVVEESADLVALVDPVFAVVVWLRCAPLVL